MDLNLVVLCGTLHNNPKIFELEPGVNLVRFPEFEPGVNLVRFPLTTKTEKRVDVITVEWMATDDELAALEPVKGDRVWVAASVFGNGHVSHIHANHVQKQGDE